MDRPPEAKGAASRLGPAPALLYAVFVVYGSLVPLAFRPRSLEAAWSAFLDIPYLQLGVGSRADWIANILLYIPLAYLLSGWLAKRTPSAAARSASVLLLCFLLAVAVEFAQLFFPPRTVSLNDLIAELIGAAAGIVLWHTAAARLRRYWDAVMAGGREARTGFVVLYAGAYLLLALFPYDFLISAAELAHKLASPNGTAMFLSASCGGTLACGARLGAEALIAAPLGAFLAMMAGRRVQGYGHAFLLGLVLGLVIEGLQTFLASGVSQGASVFTRAVGMTFGLAAYRLFDRDWLVRYRRQLRLSALLALPLYGLLLLELVGFYGRSWDSIEAALAKLDEVRFLPFYYHYFTTETQALHSLLVHAGAYAPVGVLVWLFGHGHADRRAPWLAAFLAFCLAALMEGLKLFLEGRRPDPTDTLIAAAAAALACFAISRLTAWSPIRSAPAPAIEPALRHRSRVRGLVLAGGLLASGAAVAGWLFAIQPKEHYLDESTLPQLPDPRTLPRAELPGFKMVHPRLPSPSADEVMLLRRRHREFFVRVLERGRSGRGDLQSATLQAVLEPGTVDMDLLHRRLLELSFGGRGHEQVQPLAVAYDWLHGQWTPAQRAQLAAKLADGCDYVIDLIRKERLSPYNVILYNRPLQALMACAIAVYGEEPRAGSIMAFTHDLWKERVLPVWRQVMGRNGGWHEGGEYVGIGIGQAIYQVPAMWRRATGEDLLATEPGLRGFLDFLAHRMQPDGTQFRWGDGAWFDRPVPDALPLAIELKHPLARSLKGKKDPPYPTSWPWGPLSDLTAPEGPDSMPLVRHFDGIGLVTARSDWSDKASYVTFKAGDNYWSHSHLDQGAFTVYKGGPLAIDSGLYGPVYGSDHHMNYTYQTVAHNTVTVTDPRDRASAPGKDGMRPIANDGGQRRIGSGWGVEPAPLDRAEWEAKRHIYETGNIERLLTQDGLVVAVADVTPAYTNLRSGKGLFSDRTRRVERFWRTFGYDQVDEVVVVFDQVIATEASFRKRWLLHTVHPPALQPDGFAVRYPPQSKLGRGGGRLEGKVLLPKGAIVHAVGGKGLEFFVDDRNFDEGGKLHRVISNLGPAQSEPGAWRIELSPPQDAREDLFLVVLVPTDGTAPPHRVTLLEAEGRIGCEVQGPRRTTRWWFTRGVQGAEVAITLDGSTRRHVVPALAGKP